MMEHGGSPGAVLAHLTFIHQTADKFIVKEERHKVKSTFAHVRDR